jgi:hypothetical protein
MSIESEWSDTEWAEYLGTSSDPDDQSLSARLRLVQCLKAKAGERVLNQREEQMLELLQGMNATELGFLRQSTSYRLRNDRPCWPRWHWSEEVEALYHRTIRDGQQGW